MEKYAPLNDYYNWIFEVPQVSESDKAGVRPFSREYAAKYWDDNINLDQQLQRSVEDLFSYYFGNKEQRLQEFSYNWIFSLKDIKYDWVKDWNEDNYQGLVDIISSQIELLDDDKVVFFWAQRSGCETTYGVFKRIWLNLLNADDESPIFLCPKNGFAIRFGPTGTIYIGYKNEPLIE